MLRHKSFVPTSPVFVGPDTVSGNSNSSIVVHKKVEKKIAKLK